MIKKINGYYEEVDGDKYLIISSENIHIMQKYQEVFDEMQKSYAKSYEFLKMLLLYLLKGIIIEFAFGI